MAVQCENSQKGSIENVSVNVRTEDRKGDQWFHTCSPQYLFLIVMLVAAVLVSLITLVVFLTRYQPAPAGATNPDVEAQTAAMTYKTNVSKDHQRRDPSGNITSLRKLKIVTRREWIAQPSVEEAQPLQPPVPYVIIMDTATETCLDQATCTFHVRFIQSFHLDSRGWDDIGYNFLVGGDGFVYEGRGWKGVGAHTYGYNSESIGIAFIGNFNRTLPPERQIIAAQQLIDMGLEKGYIDHNFKLLAGRQVGTNRTPGSALYEDLQKWPHWATQP